ncbi:MAG: HigA family addiction module antidote protein [Symploca sp. SIO2E6]|nr:HigA family addiction module antidote protein [Symploca sp. SIO2E6]
MHLPPTHPGLMLLEEFLKPLEMTQVELAEAIGVPLQRVNEIVNQKRGVSPETALRLGKYFGVSADFWLGLQKDCDLSNAYQKEKAKLNEIIPVSTSKSGVI